MADHQCVHEPKIEVMAKTITSVETTVIAIFGILNGKEGLVTKTELNESSNKRLWWVVGLLVSCNLVLFGRVIYAAIT